MARLKLGQLIDDTLSVREQARLLSRMRDMLREEDVRQQATAKAGRRRRQSAPSGVKVAKAKATRDKRLLTVLHTSTDPEQLAAARRELTVQQPQHEEQPTGAAQQRESRPGTVVSHHAPGTMTFWSKLGAAPHCGPGDTSTAMVFYRKVTRLLDGGGWSHGERAALHDLAAKWGPRALGNDARFMVVGTMGGRLPRALEAKIREMQKPQS